MSPDVPPPGRLTQVWCAGVLLSLVLLPGRPSALRQLPHGLALPAVRLLPEGDPEPRELPAAPAAAPGNLGDPLRSRSRSSADRPSLTDGPVSVSGEPGVPLQQVSSSVCLPERQNSAQAGKPPQLPEAGPAGRPASRVQGQLRGSGVSKHRQLCPHSRSRPQVTIRTYRKVRTPAPSQLQSPSPLIQPISIKTEPQMSLIQTGPGRASRGAEPSLAPPKRPLSRRGQTSR